MDLGQPLGTCGCFSGCCSLYLGLYGASGLPGSGPTSGYLWLPIWLAWCAY